MATKKPINTLKYVGVDGDNTCYASSVLLQLYRSPDDDSVHLIVKIVDNYWERVDTVIKEGPQIKALKDLYKPVL